MEFPRWCEAKQGEHPHRQSEEIVQGQNQGQELGLGGSLREVPSSIHSQQPQRLDP